MPKLAVFPKAFMQALCKDGTMKVSEWIALATPLDIDGLEWYSGFIEMTDDSNWPRFRKEVEAAGKTIPMMCCSLISHILRRNSAIRKSRNRNAG